MRLVEPKEAGVYGIRGLEWAWTYPTLRHMTQPSYMPPYTLGLATDEVYEAVEDSTRGFRKQTLSDVGWSKS